MQNFRAMRITLNNEKLISLIEVASIAELASPQSITRKAKKEQVLIKHQKKNFVPLNWATHYLESKGKEVTQLIEEKPIHNDIINTSPSTQVMEKPETIETKPTIEPIEQPVIEEVNFLTEETQEEESINAWEVSIKWGKYSLVLLAIGMQAFVWGLVWKDIMNSTGHPVPLLLSVFFGCLVEASCFVLVSNLKDDKKRLEDARKSYVWAFFCIQVMLELAFFDMFGQYSEYIGRTVVAVSIPFALAVYQRAFFNNEN